MIPRSLSIQEYYSRISGKSKYSLNCVLYTLLVTLLILTLFYCHMKIGEGMNEQDIRLD